MKKILGLVLLLPLIASAQNVFDGTWKINLANAQFPQKPDTLVLQNGEYTCSTCIPQIKVKADGTDQKVTGAKSYDTLAVKQVDDKTVQFTRKKNDKLVGESTDRVSDDGKTVVSEFKEYPPEGQPVTGRFVLERVSTGPEGSHPISGSFRAAKAENVSEHGLTMTLKATKDGLTLTTPTGESYDAKFDGKEYPVKGDRAGGTVSLKKVNDSTIEETYMQDGKPVQVTQMTVRGNTLEFVSKDVRKGTTTTLTADRQ